MIVRRLSDDEIYHYGIKGQKWGVRRYQNADGSLTTEGKARQKVKERKESLNHVAALSDDQLRKAIDRMRLEKTYTTLTKENISDSNERINNVMKSIGKVALGAAVVATGAIAYKEFSRYNKISRSASLMSRNLNDKDLGTEITRMTNQKKYMDLYTSRAGGAGIINRTARDAIIKTLSGATIGATAYGVHSIISGNLDREEAANYIAPRPKHK